MMKKQDKYSIVYKNIDELIPYARNPRINEMAVPHIASLIQEFGFLVPLVIKKDGEILAGHTRLKAAQLLGIKIVPCIIADNLSNIQAKAFRIAENKSAEWSKWDNDLLKLELDELKEDNFNLDLISLDAKTFDEKGKEIDKDLSRNNSSEHGASELNLNDFSADKFAHVCPRCGFHYND